MDWSWVVIAIALIAGVIATNATAAWKDVRMRQTEVVRHMAQSQGEKNE